MSPAQYRILLGVCISAVATVLHPPCEPAPCRLCEPCHQGLKPTPHLSSGSELSCDLLWPTESGRSGPVSFSSPSLKKPCMCVLLESCLTCWGEGSRAEVGHLGRGFLHLSAPSQPVSPENPARPADPGGLNFQPAES